MLIRFQSVTWVFDSKSSIWFAFESTFSTAFKDKSFIFQMLFDSFPNIFHLNWSDQIPSLSRIIFQKKLRRVQVFKIFSRSSTSSNYSSSSYICWNSSFASFVCIQQQILLVIGLLIRYSFIFFQTDFSSVVCLLDSLLLVRLRLETIVKVYVKAEYPPISRMAIPKKPSKTPPMSEIQSKRF